jgi:YD repeat-containing protein
VWTGHHTYDAAGRLYAIDNANTTSGTEPDWYVNAILYNERGQVTQVDYGNFTRTTYTYNAARGWLTQIATGYGAGTPFFQADYARRANGMIMSTTLSDQWLGGRTWAYTYDGLNCVSACKVDPVYGVIGLQN